MRKLLILCLSLCTLGFIFGQSSITIDEIMAGEKYVGYSPRSISWSPNSQEVYFRWNPEQENLASFYKTTITKREPVALSLDEERNRMQIHTFTKNGDRYLGTRHGDLFLGNITTGEELQITNTVARESSPLFDLKEEFVIYRSGNNLFRWHIGTGSTVQLTNFVAGSADDERASKEHKAWLERDQLEYFEILKARQQREDALESHSEKLKADRPVEVFLGKASLSQVTINPTGRYVSYRLTYLVPNRATTKVPDFVTTSGYINDLSARPKVGSPTARVESFILDLQRDTTFPINASALPGLRKKPAFLQEYHSLDSSWTPMSEESKGIIVHQAIFNTSGDRAIMVVRSKDNKDRWIAELNLENGQLTNVDHQHDEAWIGGPGISSWNFSSGNVGWIDDSTIWFHSEHTGYSHLYAHDLRTKKTSALTKGNFEIQGAILSRDRSRFFITSNQKHPGEKHFYHLTLANGKMTQITHAEGAHEVYISPDESLLAIRYSNSTTPWELYLMPNTAGASPTNITSSTLKRFASYPWRTPELIEFSASDGVMVPARLYRPDQASVGGPAVIFVHGAGYLQNAHKWWSSYFREYMFHNFLVDQGYTVLDIDYRGSAGYGRDWRTAIYRYMGGKDLSDQVDGAKYLVENLEVNADKIGIYGGSYGGFITLMALFTSPETFACGAALRSVTDWAHYNHGYTSNILNTPVADSIAYQRSSPIYHAEGLSKPLLMLHGMVDRNVQFQDVVRLSQRLIELKKENWELAVFPMEGHGFREASSWSDEYRRIFKLFEEHLK